VPPLARELRLNGTLLITVAAERLMSLFDEMELIASDPLSRNMLDTLTVSTIMDASSGVLNALCDGITLRYTCVRKKVHRILCTTLIHLNTGRFL